MVEVVLFSDIFWIDGIAYLPQCRGVPVVVFAALPVRPTNAPRLRQSSWGHLA